MFKNRFLLILGVLSLLLVTMTVVRPANSVPTNVNRALEASDYHQRHPELSASVASIVDTTGDFALRHPEWTIGSQSATISVTGALEASDYFQRHPELTRPAASAADLSDYFNRHPELRRPATIDLSDYFQRH